MCIWELLAVVVKVRSGVTCMITRAGEITVSKTDFQSMDKTKPSRQSGACNEHFMKT